MFNGLDDLLELDLGGPEAFGLGADSVGCVASDVIVIGIEEGLHAVERLPLVLGLVVVSGEENIREVNLAAWDVD